MYRPSDYSLISHGDMIADRVRMGAYEAALKNHIRPDSIVVDIGTGTGIMALLACRFGARKVYAIEPSNIIQIAREIADANGYSDRIVFLQDVSTRVEIAEAAHVIVSDIRGVLPLLQRNIPAIVDARKRFLRQDGVLLPQSDSIWVCPVESQEQYRHFSEPWDSVPNGFDMRPARETVTHSWKKTHFEKDAFVAEPKLWLTLDYATEERTQFASALSWTPVREGVIHGFAVWFDSVLSPGVSFTNAPGEPETIYGNAFFPLEKPVQVSNGDEIHLKLEASLVEEDYVWNWTTNILRGPVSIASVRQSTFFSAPISLQSLAVRRADYAPIAVEDVAVDRSILMLFDGQTTLGEIADIICRQFPERFTSAKDALNYVSRLSSNYFTGPDA